MQVREKHSKNTKSLNTRNLRNSTKNSDEIFQREVKIDWLFHINYFCHFTIQWNLYLIDTKSPGSDIGQYFYAPHVWPLWWHIIYIKRKQFLVFTHVTRRPCWCTKQWQNVAHVLHNNRIKFPKVFFRFCLVHQHSRRDVTWKPRIKFTSVLCGRRRLSHPELESEALPRQHH